MQSSCSMWTADSYTYRVSYPSFVARKNSRTVRNYADNKPEFLVALKTPKNIFNNLGIGVVIITIDTVFNTNIIVKYYTYPLCYSSYIYISHVL